MSEDGVSREKSSAKIENDGAIIYLNPDDSSREPGLAPKARASVPALVTKHGAKVTFVAIGIV